MKDHERLPLIPIRRGDGVWLEDFDGKRYLDAVSPWWVNVRPWQRRINQRIREQLDSLEHVMLAGFTHAPVVELSERLVQITPDGLSKVFYADNGSSGIEVALKMSHHYWINSGQPGKKRFITLTNSYHGETVAAMSVGDVALFTDTTRRCCSTPSRCPARTAPAPRGMGWEEHSRGHVRRHGADAGRARPRGRRRHRRTADPGRRRHAHVPPGSTSSCCARPATVMACT